MILISHKVEFNQSIKHGKEGQLCTKWHSSHIFEARTKRIQGVIDRHSLIIGDFNKPFSVIQIKWKIVWMEIECPYWLGNKLIRQVFWTYIEVYTMITVSMTQSQTLIIYQITNNISVSSIKCDYHEQHTD